MNDVRHIQLMNAEGEVIDLLLKSSFFNDLSGLGYDMSISYVSYADGFYAPVRKRLSQSSISGKLSFLTRATAYQDYRTLTEWIASSEKNANIKMLYTPYGYGGADPDVTFQKDVILTSISKGELDTGGYLSCNAVFQSLTPFYSVSPLEFDFEEETGEYTSRYSRTFSYVYIVQGTSLTATLTLASAMDGRFTLEVGGNFSDPIIEMFDSDGETIGYMEISGETFVSGETLYVSTMPSGIGAWKETAGGVRTDLIDKINIQDGTEVFFSIPTDEEITIRVRASDTSDLEGDLKIYSFYKTR